MKLLKDKTNAPAPECGPLPVRKTVNILPVISQTAAGRLIQPGQQMEQGALPAAGRSRNGKEIPLHNSERYPVQGRHLAFPLSVNL